MIQPGMEAEYIDNWVREFGKKYDVTPAFMGFEGYEYTINYSVNNEVTHGLPTNGKVVPNDCLLKIDTGFINKGMYSDAAQTYIIGNPPEIDKKLSEVTLQALWAGIEEVKAGVRIGTVGNAINTVLKKNNFSIIKVLGGHGLGYGLHESPFVPHYGRPGKGFKLFENQVITLEPLVNIGSGEVYIDEEDKWTILTKDKSHSAQWEHDILVTKDGYEVLTEIEESEILE